MTDALFKDMSDRFPAGTAPSNWTRSYPGQFPCWHALSDNYDAHVLPLAGRRSPSRGRMPPPLGRPERDVHHRLRIHAPTDDRPISRQPRRGGSVAHLPGPFPSVGHGREAPGQAARRCGHRGHDRHEPGGESVHLPYERNCLPGCGALVLGRVRQFLGQRLAPIEYGHEFLLQGLGEKLRRPVPTDPAIRLGLRAGRSAHAQATDRTYAESDYTAATKEAPLSHSTLA